MPASPSPDHPLSHLLTPVASGPNRFTWSVPDGWQQGRGAFGGLVLGAMVRALEAVAGADRPLRSLTAELPGPTLPGPTELKVEALRVGSGVSTLAVRLVQQGEVQAHAVGVLARPRATDRDGVGLTAPTRPPWRNVEVLPVEPPLGPAFAKFWEFRNVGPLPMSRSDQTLAPGDPAAAGWIRSKDAGPVRDAAWAIACVDAWWPAALTYFAAPRPVGTVAFSFQLVGELEGLGDAPLFFVARDAAIRDGYAVELRELWTEGGRLVALNQQTIAIIR